MENDSNSRKKTYTINLKTEKEGFFKKVGKSIGKSLVTLTAAGVLIGGGWTCGASLSVPSFVGGTFFGSWLSEPFPEETAETYKATDIEEDKEVNYGTGDFSADYTLAFDEVDEDKKVALLKLDRAIDFDTTDQMIELLAKAKKADVDGYIIEIQSPGGSAMASEILYDRVKEISEDKPVIAVTTSYMYSGAYWVSAGADAIIAHEAAGVGSIGVRSSFADYAGQMEDLGIEYHDFTQGEHKGAGDPYRTPTEEELDYLEKNTREIYDNFVEDIAEGRDMSVEEVEELATGRTWKGEEGKKLGLVDLVGDRRMVAEWMEDQLESGYVIEVYEMEKKQIDFYF